MGMTIDKAIEDLKASKRWKCKPSNECINMAIKALEQSLCEDTISRRAAIEEAKQYWYKPDIAGALAELPSVYPRQRTGHWITKIKSNPRGDMWPTNPKCSVCGGEPYYSNNIYNYKFCPYCGAKMINLQESEDNNG